MFFKDTEVSSIPPSKFTIAIILHLFSNKKKKNIYIYIYRHNYNYNTIVGGGEVRALNVFVGIGNKKI